jgi:radical SAM protein with 4Fe4S-binding SPASM domain
MSSLNNFFRITIDTNPEDCNLHCIMCEEHSVYSNFITNLKNETGINKRRMPVEWLESIFQQAKELGVIEIIPSTMGEPLLYSGFEEIISLCQKYSIKLNLTTNGTFPKKSIEEWSKLLIPICSDIKISWNGSTANTSEKIMKGISFEKNLSKLNKLIKYRDEYFRTNSYSCRITLQLTFLKNNMHELSDIIKLAASLGVDRVKGHHLWAHFDEIKNLSMKANLENINQWNEYVKEANETVNTYLKPNQEKVILENIIPLQEYLGHEIPANYNCPFLEKELWISATGNISPCCAPDTQRKSLGDFGNIQNQTLQEILNSSAYQNLIESYKTYPLCKTCNMRKP